MSVARRVLDYARRVAHDYRAVAADAAAEAARRPAASAALGAGLALLAGAARTAPAQRDLEARLCRLRQRMALLPVRIHSRKADGALHTYTDLLNTARLDVYDIWFFSLVVKSDMDQRVFSAVSQDPNLKDWPWTRLARNLVDVGAFGRFYYLEQAFQDYDVAEDEFQKPAENPQVKKDAPKPNK